MAENANELIVKVDRSPEIEKEKAEKLQAQKELSELKQKVFQDKKSQLGCDDESITTIEALEGWQTAKEAEKQSKKPTGSAPINQTSGGKPNTQKVGYSDFGEMVVDLYARQSTDLEAKENLSTLFKKLVDKEGIPKAEMDPLNEGMATYRNKLLRKKLGVD